MIVNADDGVKLLEGHVIFHGQSVLGISRYLTTISVSPRMQTGAHHSRAHPAPEKVMDCMAASTCYCVHWFHVQVQLRVHLHVSLLQ